MFTDTELKAYKEAAIRTDRDDLYRLICRLEAAEKIVIKDHPVNFPACSVCKKWRKVKGE